MKILITGGAGFVGSHAAEYFARKGNEVVCYDNLSRGELLRKDSIDTAYNWNYLKNIKNVKLIKGDIRDLEELKEAAKSADAIIHTAAQTAVTTSVVDPKTDFEVNALGTFNVMEAARTSDVEAVVYCSTNKVYGDNVNAIKVMEKEKRYVFEDKFKNGISESFAIDRCEHTPYGCSKLTGDIYCQDYGHLYGLNSGVFRMSCIYGTRQFGVEDQGWVAWFAISTIFRKPITIYGDGKQVRDVLYVEDLVKAYDAFLNLNSSAVLNIGGGQENTISLLELLDLLEELTGHRSKINFADWRPSDQKVYVSDISKAREVLKWAPEVGHREGIKRLLGWVEDVKKGG
ncbi:MAG: GDP-mannose 4,6-dehydratase [Candidatus Methanoperedens sp.]|nr:GDP-mannose 4,6-dehydratase [Candidatus Methanoperedens sp.]MCZ7370646.1 GDP-mannose 4,6-dehydratase [Candidatus Methanoperedens sp.]